jgi:hypothetical protein
MILVANSVTGIPTRLSNILYPQNIICKDISNLVGVGRQILTITSFKLL